MGNGRRRLFAMLLALMLATSPCPALALADDALGAAEVTDAESADDAGNGAGADNAGGVGNEAGAGGASDTGNAADADEPADAEKPADTESAGDGGENDDPAPQAPSVTIAYVPVAFGETSTLTAEPADTGEGVVLAYAWELQAGEDAKWTDVADAEEATLAVTMSERAVGARYRVRMTVSPATSEDSSGASADSAPVYSEPVELKAADHDSAADYAGPTIEIRRLVNPYTCCHLYTPSPEEADATTKAGWMSQGTAWLAPETSDRPVHRVYNPYSGEHFYTVDPAERDTLVSLGWEDEGVGFYSVAKWGIPIYRLYNPYNGDHHFTASERECEDLAAVGWTDEGIALRGVQAGDAYDGTPDWAEVVVKDKGTGVVAEGMVFAQQTLVENAVEFQAANVAETNTARYNLLRKALALAKTDAFAVYDAKLVMHKADGTTEDFKTGFGDLELSFPVSEKLNGKSTQVMHIGTRANGEAFVINRTSATVEKGAVKLTVNHLSESGSSEFVVAVGEGAMPNASVLDDFEGPATDGARGNDDAMAQEMHRLYNPHSGEHFYTADADERDAVVDAGWVYEGVGWIAPESSYKPVYRLYSGTDHHYTMDAAERDAIIAEGWVDEGIGWYSDDAEGVPLYRQYNPYVQPDASENNAGAHNYTTSIAENDGLVAVGWIAEGIGWYGVALD